MYTQCPECGTVFRVSATVLRAAHGQVRCGVCDTTFDALDYLTEELSAEAVPTPVGITVEEPESPPAPVAATDAPGEEEVLADLERISAELAAPDPAPPPQPFEAPGLDDSIEVEIIDPALAENIVVASDPEPVAAEAGDEAALEFNLPEDQWARVFVEDAAPTIPPLDLALQQAAAAALVQEPFQAPQLDDSIEVEILEAPADSDVAPVESIELQADGVEDDEDPLARTDRYPALQQMFQERGPDRRRGGAPADESPEPVVPLHLGAEPIAAGEPLVAKAMAADAAREEPTEPDSGQIAPIEVDAPEYAAPPPATRDLGILAQAPTVTLRGLARPVEALALPEDDDDEETPWWQRAGWVALFIVLLLTLAVQAAHHFRDQLATNPLFREPLTAFYARLGEPLDPPGDLRAYELRQWGAAAEASGGVLRVRASILNRTDRSQLHPLLRVTLEDRFGGRLGQREFEPREYLPGRKAPAGPLAARGRADADLSIADPGTDAVGFALDVCLRHRGRLTCASDLPPAAP